MSLERKHKSRKNFLPHLFTTLISFLLFASCSNARQETTHLKTLMPPEMPIQFEFDGFRFSPGRTCDTPWIDLSFCEATGPKQWTAKEFSVATEWLKGLPESFKLQVKMNHFLTVYRYY